MMNKFRFNMTLHVKTALIAWFAAALTPAAYSQRLITTVAGSELLFKGESGPATAAALGRVTGVSVDSLGRAVFADPYYHLVFRANTDGRIEVLAGNNVRGYSGDGGSAKFAALAVPQGTAIDASGNLYIADFNNSAVRRVTPQGVITTYAGTGRAGFSGDGGRAGAAALRFPLSLAVDSAGTLYINDANNRRIRKVTASGTITTFAGNGELGDAREGANAAQSPLNEVEGMAVDRQGNLYIAEFNGHKIKRITPQGIISTVAGNGQPGYSGDGGDAKLAQLFSPGGVAIDKDGNVLILDTNNFRIRRVASDGKIATIAGSGLNGFAGDGGPATRASFRGAFGLAATPAGDIYLADRDNYRIRRIDSQGNISTVAGNGLLQSGQEGGPATSAPLVEPFGVAVDNSGSLYIADSRSHVVRRVDGSGRASTFAGTGAGEFTGDGGRAARAGLFLPTAVAVDRAGNVFIADSGNESIRKVDTGGNITTVAGNLLKGQDIEQGQATAAKLFEPTGVAVDGAGNIFIAEFGKNRIRRVSNGVIETYAGTGDKSSSGDGGPATRAGIVQPFGVAIDGANNLYIAEFGGGRIRKITPQGIISTLTGAGQTAGRAADNIPAANARLSRPTSIAVDREGNVYIADGFTNLIHRVSPAGVINLIAGNGNSGFFGDGGLAVNAAFDQPFGLAVDSNNGTLYVGDSLNNRVRAILTSRPTFAPVSESISLNVTSDGAGEVANIDLASSFPGLVCTASTDGQKWLRLTNTSVTLPSTLEIRVDPTGLAPGAQRGEIRVSCPAAQVAGRVIPVNLQVQTGAGPKLAVDARTLTVSTTAGTAALLRQLSVRNAGSGSAAVAVTSNIESGAGWLRTSAPEAVTAAAPVNVEVTIDPSRLNPGTYSGSVTVSGANANEKFVIPVLVTVNPSPAKIVLPLTALTFTAASGGGTPLTQTVAVLNGGQGTMSWRADGETLSGPNWLKVLTASGTADAGALEASTSEIGVDTAGLTPGKTYYARLRISSAGAPNSPQTVSVALNVLGASENPGAEVSPSAVTFSSSTGVNPGSQTVRLANLSSRPVSYTSSISVPWLSIVPASATLNPGEPARLVIQPLTGDLTPESYKGSITLQFDDKTTRKIDVLALITASDVSTAGKGQRSAGGCTTSSVNAQFTGGQTPLRARAGQALNLEARVLDNCGVDISTVRGTSVKMGRISTGEPGFDLLHVGGGKWTKSWSPKAAANTTVRSYMTVVVPLPNAKFFLDSLPVDVVMTGATAVPLVEPGNVLNAASFKQNTPIAPGMLISVFGTELAEDPGQVASTVPLPTELSNTEVRLGDKPLRLLFSSGSQINAQIPFDLNTNTEHQIVVKRGDTLSSPENFAVSSTQPAIFATNQRGTGQGAITNAVTGRLADPATPVRAGDFISIYCTGLGTVTPAVDAGLAAPSTTLSTTVKPVTVTVGGRPANVTFSGLAPGFVGLYQVNAVIPAGVAGDAIEVVLDIDGQTSPPVTIAVR
jgi:uncharacterized protein (TIGR03437 family)